MHDLGKMNEDFEEREEALEIIKKFENMLANNDSVFFDLADFELIIDHYTTTFNYTKAIAACNTAINQYPFSTELLIDKSQILAMSGEFAEALDIIKHLELSEPQNADVMLTHGIIYTQKGDFSEAIEYLKKAAALAGNRDDILFNIGLTYQSWGKFSSAIKYYKKCLELSLENEIALQELLYCLEVTGTLEENIPFFQQFVDNDPYALTAGLHQMIADIPHAEKPAKVAPIPAHPQLTVLRERNR